MIIHLSDRQPIEVSKEDWTADARASSEIASGVTAYMAVISSEENIVICGALHKSESDTPFYEGGYLVSKKKKRHKKKIFSKLNLLLHHMSVKAREHVAYNQSVIDTGDVMLNLDEMLTSVKRGMPPEKI